MLNEFEREEISNLKEQVNDLQFQLAIQQAMILGLMSELGAIGLNNFTPFELAIRSELERFPINSEERYQAQLLIDGSKEKAIAISESSKVI
ncbi:TPA: hypothetical protein PXJ58_003077 [Yersinia enterocolitica]|uniref:hypothetical protein n=1 Tax=Yersinia enterocolitica TaxID=630 RepID=UPI00065A8DDC|nr:hypothetical protein [Yersinia enterocolitica]CRY22314.1 Uncharacterised protein [Yersinia enterocolitica]HDL6739087.1 hypothetical protein [Yersinia enterocolitica]HDM8421680.1 hypothetical protein [Yersinia enterocolitica]